MYDEYDEFNPTSRRFLELKSILRFSLRTYDFTFAFTFDFN